MVFLFVCLALIVVACGLFLFGTEPKPERTNQSNRLDEVYSIQAARGDKLEHLSKRKRQTYSGVDIYRCGRCGRNGPPWVWVTDLNDVPGDTIQNVCPCGGTLYIVD
jgi:hypothetical protein